MASEVIKQRALLIGRILHRGTGQPIDGELTITSPQGTIVANIRNDGYFAVSGRPEILFPHLSGMPAVFELDIHANSAQFRIGYADITHTQNLVAGEDFDPPVQTGTVLFNADAVYVRGRVRSGVDPYTPISPATVELLEGGFVTHATVTAPDGSYAFNNVVVIAPVELRCTAANYVVQTQMVAIDYGVPVNEVAFRMTPV